MASSAQGRERPSSKLSASLFMLESARFAQPAATSRDELAAQHALAVRYCGAGRYAEALPLFEEVGRRSRGVLGPTHIDTLTAEGNVAATCAALQQWSKAIPLLDAALRVRTDVLGATHTATDAARSALATALQLTGEIDRARALHEDVVDHRRRVLGPAHHDTLTARLGLALTHVDDGKVEIAVMQLAAAVEDAGSAPTAAPPLLLAMLRTHLGLCLADIGQRDRAVALVRQAIDELSVAVGPHDAEVIELRNSVLGVSA